jgi:membrane-associated protein
MFDVQQLIQGGGILGILLVSLIVFAESGLLIGFFLPGDTLLLGAGVVASQGQMPIAWLVPALVVSATLGGNVGYSIGRRTGHRIFRKKDGILFQQEHIARAEKFYETHGGKTIILARFIPVVRTFAPVVAGVGKMPRGRFMFFNVIGSTIWAAGVTLLGYWLGSRIPNIDTYIQWIILGVVVVSFGLAIFHVVKEKSSRQRIAEKFKLLFRNIFLNKKLD